MNSSLEGAAPKPPRNPTGAGRLAGLALLGSLLLGAEAGAQDAELRGAYVFRAGGCYVFVTPNRAIPVEEEGARAIPVEEDQPPRALPAEPVEPLPAQPVE